MRYAEAVEGKRNDDRLREGLRARHYPVLGEAAIAGAEGQRHKFETLSLRIMGLPGYRFLPDGTQGNAYAQVELPDPLVPGEHVTMLAHVMGTASTTRDGFSEVDYIAVSWNNPKIEHGFRYGNSVILKDLDSQSRSEWAEAEFQLSGLDESVTEAFEYLASVTTPA